MKANNDLYLSEKYIDLLLYLKHRGYKSAADFENDDVLSEATEEVITLKKWWEYRLTHSRIKHSPIGKLLVKIKRRLGIKFY